MSVLLRRWFGPPPLSSATKAATRIRPIVQRRYRFVAKDQTQDPRIDYEVGLVHRDGGRALAAEACMSEQDHRVQIQYKRGPKLPISVPSTPPCTALHS